MKYPNFNEERKLWRKGYKMVVGIDESGRGPLAAPVVAAAVCFKKNPESNIYNPISNLKDSKKLSFKKREEIYKILLETPKIKWGIGRVSEKVIDRINILEATKLAMKRAVRNLEKKCSCSDFLIVDGNFGINLDIPQKSVIKADEKVFSCVAAGIIAKVTRDRMMFRYHKKYPCYCFDRHKGYPTKLHRKMLKKHGPCKIHRRSFRPVSNY
ncbi:ribonuclease HII [Patescibacteria group bacterium]|nr:ribonuclease HII [Patescibacteria group bacterium]